MEPLKSPAAPGDETRSGTRFDGRSVRDGATFRSVSPVYLEYEVKERMKTLEDEDRRRCE